jgi:hypothetical protein
MRADVVPPVLPELDARSGQSSRCMSVINILVQVTLARVTTDSLCCPELGARTGIAQQ